MDLADRVRHQLAGVKGVTEQEMFGGLSFLVAGHMCCGVLGDDLIARLPPELHHDALVRPHVREMDMGGRSMRGLVLVDRVGVADDPDLELWVRLGLARAKTLPPKPLKRAVKARTGSGPTRPAPQAKKAAGAKASAPKAGDKKVAGQEAAAAAAKRATTKKVAVPKKRATTKTVAVPKKPATTKKVAVSGKPATTKKVAVAKKRATTTEKAAARGGKRSRRA
jgi:hypothetical protein